MSLRAYDVCLCKHERRIHTPACRGSTIFPTGERVACPCFAFHNRKGRRQ